MNDKLQSLRDAFAYIRGQLEKLGYIHKDLVDDELAAPQPQPSFAEAHKIWLDTLTERKLR